MRAYDREPEEFEAQRREFEVRLLTGRPRTQKARALLRAELDAYLIGQEPESRFESAFRLKLFVLILQQGGPYGATSPVIQAVRAAGFDYQWLEEVMDIVRPAYNEAARERRGTR